MSTDEADFGILPYARQPGNDGNDRQDRQNPITKFLNAGWERIEIFLDRPSMRGLQEVLYTTSNALFLHAPGLPLKIVMIIAYRPSPTLMWLGWIFTSRHLSMSVLHEVDPTLVYTGILSVVTCFYAGKTSELALNHPDFAALMDGKTKEQRTFNFDPNPKFYKTMFRRAVARSPFIFLIVGIWFLAATSGLVQLPEPVDSSSALFRFIVTLLMVVGLGAFVKNYTESNTG